MKRAIFFAVAALTMATSNAFAAGETVMVGGQAMYSSKDIVDNAVNSADHTTLVAAVKAAGLVDTLKSAGPFTVFAPTNEAFSALPPGTVETLVKPENKAALTSILTYHVVPGRYDFRKLDTAIKADGGKTELKTINGEMLTFSENGPHNIVVADASGHTADISTYDVVQSNGVIMVVDKVLMPK
ncbi:fasciclin domain-containing protein [Paraburkholderia terrae]|uniref:fasciclin domain-containing protein n=1 Tax=Paraburkholderia terrae TaxID=311230 RepID=UPI00296B1259|nr:fasciclin domain-containing protein [Paraburkholderia terrae]MDW3657321.1 fasciclin domain-containing protein [Paraburkholderia terrae]